MDLPLEIEILVQKRLGRQALEIQRIQGRGAWFAQGTNNAEYKSITRLQSAAQDADLMNQIKNSNPQKQIVIVFEWNRTLKIATVDIE